MKSNQTGLYQATFFNRETGQPTHSFPIEAGTDEDAIADCKLAIAHLLITNSTGAFLMRRRNLASDGFYEWELVFLDNRKGVW